MYIRSSLSPLDQAVQVVIDVGDGLHLSFDDRRVGARFDDRAISLQLTGASIPDDLLFVRVKGQVGAEEIDQRLTAEPHLNWSTVWDGTGATAGRPWVSDLEVGWEHAARFPRPHRTRWWTRRVVAGSLDARSYGFGGFVPSVVHRLDVDANLLWRGDGSQKRGAVNDRAAVLGNIEVGADELAVPDGQLVHIFDKNGLLEGSLQARRRRVITTAAHDREGRLVRYSHLGREYAIEHRPEQKSLSGESVIQSPSDVWVGVELDGLGRAITLLDQDHNAVSFEYSDIGSLVRIVEPTGLVTEIERDQVGRALRLSDSTGRVERIHHLDGMSDVLMSTAEGRTRRYMRITEPDGSRANATLDSAGLATISFSDANGTIIRQPDGNTRSSIQATHAVGRSPVTVDQTTVESPSGRILAITRENSKDSERLTVGERVWLHRFTDEGETTVTRPPSGVERRATNEPGAALTLSTPGRLDLEIRFDAKRRPKKSKRGRAETVYGYDQHGRLAWSELGRVRHQIQHDERGRLIGIKTPDGSLGFGRTSAGWVDSITNAAGNTTRIGRRADGLILHIAYPSVNRATSGIVYEYDRDGLCTRKSFRDGQESMPGIEYERDETGRVASLTAEDTKIFVAWDPNSGMLTELLASTGQGIVWHWDGDMAWAEEARGRVCAHIEKVYDDHHLIIEQSVNQSHALSYRRGTDGLVHAVGPLEIHRDRSSKAIVGYALGSLVTRFNRDDDGRVFGQDTHLGQLATVFFAEQLERDDHGRIVNVLENQQGVDRRISYHYDASGRLAAAALDGTKMLSARWDEAANLVELDRQGRSVSLPADDADRLASIAGMSTKYDAAGNLTELGPDGAIRRYDYDGLGRFTATTDRNGSGTTHHLDPLGRLIEIEPHDPAAAHLGVRLVWDRDTVAATLDPRGEVDIRFIDIGEDGVPRALIRNSNLYLLLRDHMGSVRAVVDANDGTVVQSLTFDPFGRMLANSSPGWQPFGFAGGLTDPISGVVRLGRRTYEPFIGRYLSRHPDGYQGGSANLYSFMHGDPVNPVTTGDAFGSWPRSADRGLSIDDPPESTPLGELTLASDPYLHGRPVSPDRAWFGSQAWHRGVSDGRRPDPITNVMRTWSAERNRARVSFDEVWNPLDACLGLGDFEYRPSASPGTVGRLASVTNVYLLNQEGGQGFTSRLKSDIARVVDAFPG